MRIKTVRIGTTVATRTAKHATGPPKEAAKTSAGTESSRQRRRVHTFAKNMRDGLAQNGDAYVYFAPPDSETTYVLNVTFTS